MAVTRNHPKVTIGLPVYNGERFLAEALESLLAQTFVDFELIISDNASTDGTSEICQKFVAKDKRIRYYRNEKNLGAAPNHNRVFTLSSSEYFKWAGYDDLTAPTFLDRCVDVLDRRPEVVLCMPNSRLIDEHGESINELVSKADTSAAEPHKRFRKILHNLDKGDQVYGLIRSSALRKTSLHGSYPSSDLVFLAELALYGVFHSIDDPLFCRRRHNNQSTTGALTVERNRVIWFDTSLEGKITLPKWQYLFGCLNAIRRAPLTRYQQVYCYSQIVRWVLYPPHFRAMGRDALIAIEKLAGRNIYRSRMKMSN